MTSLCKIMGSVGLKVQKYKKPMRLSLSQGFFISGMNKLLVND